MNAYSKVFYNTSPFASPFACALLSQKQRLRFRQLNANVACKRLEPLFLFNLSFLLTAIAKVCSIAKSKGCVCLIGLLIKKGFSLLFPFRLLPLLALVKSKGAAVTSTGCQFNWYEQMLRCLAPKQMFPLNG